MAVSAGLVSSILSSVTQMVSGSRSAEGDTGLAAVIKTPSMRKTSTNISGAFGGNDILQGELGRTGKVRFAKEPSFLMYLGLAFLVYYIYKEL